MADPGHMLTRGEVQAAMAEVAEPIRDSYLASWASWRRLREENPEFVLPLEAVERKAIIHRHVVHQMGLRLPDGFQITDRPGFNCLPVAANLLCVFKSLEQGAPVAYRTAQQRGIERQQLSGTVLDGLAEFGITGPPTIVTVGYDTSADLSEISRVIVDWRCRGHQPWEFYLYPDTLAVVEPLEFPGIERVRPAIIESSLEDDQAAEAEDEEDAQEGGDSAEGA